MATLFSGYCECKVDRHPVTSQALGTIIDDPKEWTLSKSQQLLQKPI
jgi:hypothetical protein